ncbi:lysylphosphatidylglycerol synthase domain-containing protein [Pseudomonas akapageensis]|uniref:lysylphosphatidylglycerol synthase domain-containing protein n=1 Tax=Pseudomonas akapageensis TaxID=2609961 RepID=UPI001407AB7D|nr:lysylphosphatidylglycerol synthase domain-containing protein [Pseudomonas akapageensis]
MKHDTDERHAGRWVWAKRGLTLAFFILVPVMLYMLVRNLEWQELKQALQSYRLSTLALGFAITLCSYTLFSSYDLLGRHYTGHTLPARQVLSLAFVCYAFNLNLGSWVGGVALRYRLYSKMGLDVPTITRVLSLSLVTNWLGHLLIAGSVFIMGLPPLPKGFAIGAMGLLATGAVLLLVAGGYLLACRFSKRRTWTLRGHEVTLPSLRLAAAQALMGACNWMSMALLIYVLLPAKIDYPTILSILVISSVAGVITHIPAGLGVLEAVFITLLYPAYSKGTILAALIGYRALYYLLPLAVACVVFLVLEHHAGKDPTPEQNTERETV